VKYAFYTFEQNLFLRPQFEKKKLRSIHPYLVTMTLYVIKHLPVPFYKCITLNLMSAHVYHPDKFFIHKTHQNDFDSNYLVHKGLFIKYFIHFFIFLVQYCKM
jgi:hypothetical protein